MSKTAVLFISHMVNDETIFRFDCLKRASELMQYDLYWAIDQNCITDLKSQEKQIPQYANIYEFSYEKYEKCLPFCVFNPQNGNERLTQARRLNATPSAVMLFNEDNPEYDYVWSVEYDVCFMGKWDVFFRKYDGSISDMITTNVGDCHNGFAWDKWDFFKNGNRQLMDNLLKRKLLSRSLNCLCRMSNRLMRQVKKQLKDWQCESKPFFEWVWSTVAYMKGWEVQEFESNQFHCYRMPPNFDDFRLNVPYHPLKMDIKWEDILLSHNVEA